MCSLSKEQSMLSRENSSECIFFFFFNFRIMPLFQPRIFIPYQSPHSRALTPTCGAFVLPQGTKYWGKRTKCWLPAFLPFPAMFSKGILLRGVKSHQCLVILIWLKFCWKHHKMQFNSIPVDKRSDLSVESFFRWQMNVPKVIGFVKR